MAYFFVDERLFHSQYKLTQLNNRHLPQKYLSKFHTATLRTVTFYTHIVHTLITK